MTIANYIHDLLYRHDCVIVPDFGSFITNTVSAKINEEEQLFYPPTKQISFNSHLKLNDGLLVNYIAKAEGISYSTAFEKANTVVANWQKKIQSGELSIDKIGCMLLNDKGQLVFEPSKDISYLTSSFGLSSFHVPTKRHQQKAAPLVPAKTPAGISHMAKYAAAAAILLALSFVGWDSYENNRQQKEMVEKQKVLEYKIQNATFVISDPLPTINLNVVKEASKSYHVIAGSFQFEANAKKKVARLKAKGFLNAAILGKNRWGLTQVAYESFSDRFVAYKNLTRIRKLDAEDAWMLHKSFR
ncbi:MAG: hypothetical protein GKR88_03100 [Flavobacteriaceae bacterium]|nr:MAG: hypothetical protein GKR88_03100 [Flavobacteriaceae bacterium]